MPFIVYLINNLNIFELIKLKFLFILVEKKNIFILRTLFPPDF